jgi:8-oxo-dGTP diphosphatase
VTDGVKAIAIAVVESDDRFLIGQRPAGAVLAGFWEFPGGKVEADETPEQAAVRECAEEAGIEIRVKREYPSHVHNYNYGQLRLYFFDCSPRNPDQRPREPFRWVSRQALKDYRFPAGNQRLLEILTAERPDT